MKRFFVLVILLALIGPAALCPRGAAPAEASTEDKSILSAPASTTQEELTHMFTGMEYARSH